MLSARANANAVISFSPASAGARKMKKSLSIERREEVFVISGREVMVQKVWMGVATEWSKLSCVFQK